MQITFQTAKNGEATALADNVYLHSSYAPSREAERFAQGLNFPYKPQIIIITEPALSYSAKFIREKFNNAQIGVIRYVKDFEKYNSNFDFTLNFFEHPDFEAYLESLFNEEQLLTIQFISWTPSAKVFANQDKIVWKSIKAALERSKTLLITRQYFEKKWLYNTAVFYKYLQKPVKFSGAVNKPAVIISSGPSLKPALKVIKENRTRLFVLCLSSAISACLSNGIIPDLCMTTDGGFWAGEHLKKLSKNDIPLALPSEALCNKSLLKKLHILPMVYDDGISKELCKASADLTYVHAVRNGTVSGTALLFACEYCTKDIFLCGLDMASQVGFQHLQPNELEANNSVYDCRIKTKEKRLTASQFGGASLEIYKNWFCSNKIELNGRKVYRVINDADKKNSLNWIQDIDEIKFQKSLIAAGTSESDSGNYFTDQKINAHELASKTLLFFKKNFDNEEWKKQLFPLDYVSLIHNPSNNEIISKMNSEYEKLKKKIEAVLNE